MTKFSDTLKALIERRGWKQKEAAKRFRISSSAMSLYLNAERRPARDQMGSILRAFDHDERTELLHAFLFDDIPGAEFADLILLERTGEASRLRDEAVNAWRSFTMPKAASDSLALIAAAAVTDAQLQEAIISLSDFIQSCSPAKKKK